MKARNFLFALVLIGVGSLSQTAWADGATVPFYAATNVQPNIMLLIDSSGNMSSVVDNCGSSQECKKFSVLKRVLTGSALLTGETGDFIYDPEIKGNLRLQDAINPNAFIRIIPLNCTPAPPPGGEAGTTCLPQADGNYFTMLLANDIVMEYSSDSVMSVATNLGDYMLTKGYTSSNTLYITDSGQVNFTFDNYSTGGVGAPRKIYTLTTTLNTTYSKTFTTFFIRNYWVTVPPSYYYEFDSHLSLNGTSAGANEAGLLDIIKDVYVLPVTWNSNCYEWLAEGHLESCWQLDTTTTPINFVFADDQDLNMVAKNYNYKQYLKAFKREYLRTRLNQVNMNGSLTPLYNTYGFRPVTDTTKVFFTVRDSQGLRSERRRVFELIRTCGTKAPATCTTTGVQCFPIPTCDLSPRQYPNSTITDLAESASKPLVVDLIMKSIPRVATGTATSPSFPRPPLASSCSGILTSLVYQADTLKVSFTNSVECPFSFYYGSSTSYAYLDVHLRSSLGLTSNPTTIAINEPSYNNFFKNMNYEYLASVDNGVVDIYHNRARFGAAILDSGNSAVMHDDLDFDLIDLSANGVTPTPLNETWMDNFGYNFTFNETNQGANLLANIANDAEEPFHDQTMQNAIVQVEDLNDTPFPSAIYNMALYFDWVGSPARLTVDPSNIVTWFGDPAPGVAAVTGDPAVIGECRQNFVILISGGASNGSSWGTQDVNYSLHALDRLMHGTCGDHCTDEVTSSSAGKNSHSTDLWQEVKPFVVHFDPDAGPDNFLAEMMLLACHSGVSWFTEPNFLIDGVTVTDEDFKSGSVTLADLNDDGEQEVCSSFIYWATDEDSLKTTLVKIFNAILAGSYTRSAPVFDPAENAVLAGFFEIKPGKLMWEGHLYNYDLSEVGSNLEGSTVTPIDAAVSLADQVKKAGSDETGRDVFTVQALGGGTYPKLDFTTANWAALQPLLKGLDATPVTQTDTNALIKFIRAEPGATFADGTTRTTVLGAIYHSQPMLVGPPVSDSNSSLFENYTEYSIYHKARPPLVYVGANDGMLHSFFMHKVIDADTAMEEYFGYIPNYYILRNLKLLLSEQWWYVDGNPSAAELYVPADPATYYGNQVWTRVQAAVSSGDCNSLADCGCTQNNLLYGGKNMCWRTVVMTGLRQGGNSYSALDVTDSDSVGANHSIGSAPQIIPMWEFADGAGSGNTLMSTNLMGESWSTPFMAELLNGVSGGTKTTDVVAMFGGGRTTPGMSSGSTVGQPNKGHFFYFLNLENGQLFKSGGAVVSRRLVPDRHDPNWKTKVLDGATNETAGYSPSYVLKNKNEVPSDPTVVDVNQDGISDIIYFGDMQGRVWKMNVSSSDWSQRQLCLFYDTGDLSGTLNGDTAPGCPATDANTECGDVIAQPVFYAPTVMPLTIAASSTVKTGLKIAQNVGSGNLVIFGTGHIEDSQEARDLTRINRIFAVLDAQPLTSNTVGDQKTCRYGLLWSDSIRTQLCPQCAYDIEYPFALQAGEKIISKPYVINGILIFQTFTPITSQICDPGEVRFWETDALTFYGIFNLNNTVGGKYMTLEEFTTSGYALTNKWGIIVFTPPGALQQVAQIGGMKATIMSWSEGLSFPW